MVSESTLSIQKLSLNPQEIGSIFNYILAKDI